MFLLMSLACTPEVAEPACPSFPDEATAAPTVLTEDDDCGYWSVAAGAQLVVSIHLHDAIEESGSSNAEDACEVELGDELSLPYGNGTYGNLSGDGPKWTSQILAGEATDSSTVDFTCFDDTEWHGKVQVE